MKEPRPHPIDRRCFLTQTGAALAVASRLELETPAEAAAAERPSTPFPYVDGLTFLSAQPSDLLESGLSALIFDCSQAQRVDTSDGSIKFVRSFEACQRSIIRTRRLLRESEYGFLATRGSQVWEAYHQGQTAIFLQFQGCEPLEGSIDKIDLFHELGLRILQITHHNDNPFGGGGIEREWTGLTELGRRAVARMNDLGMLPDLSHSSHLTSLDVIRGSKTPVVLSHGAARALVNNARCAPDEVIRELAERGGVMGIFMMSFWLTTGPKPSSDSLVRQVKHVIKVGGIESVGIANDFSILGQTALAKIGNNNAEGIKGYLPWWQSVAKEGILGFDREPQHAVIPELNNVRRMFLIQEALENDGFTASEIEKIMGSNWIRVLTDVLG